MLMTIEFSRRIYQDLIIRTLRLVRYECFINHTCVLSYDQFCAQICARFHARLINEGHCVPGRSLLNNVFLRIDVFDICELYDISVGQEKAFDCLDHAFLFSKLQTFGYGSGNW